MKINFAAIVVVVIILTACKSNQGYTNPNQSGQQSQNRQQRGGGGRPTADQLIKEMDSNNDNQLSKEEVKGPLANDFSTIDTDSDGFITKEELENAPKPQRNDGQGGGGMRR